MSDQRRPGRYPVELRERAVRMVFEAERHCGSLWEAAPNDNASSYTPRK